MSSLNSTPQADRLHIGFFGRRNSGKSSLINAFAGQQVSIVSPVAGTTTDPVTKTMEIAGLGACVLMDTAGFDDDAGELGESRVEKTRLSAQRTDLAVILFTGEALDQELDWHARFAGKGVPAIPVISQADRRGEAELDALERRLAEAGVTDPLRVSAVTGQGVEVLRRRLVRSIPEGHGSASITGELVGAEDLVLLVMPQDIQAPKGRLVLPQVQTIRDLLDKKCLVMSVTTDKLDVALESLKRPPKLIITDSQAFPQVHAKKPPESLLTSFSVLFSAYKGDYPYYKASAGRIGALTADSRVLIAECCTHAPLSEDIGREQIPRMLRGRAGEGLAVDVVSGTDFPDRLGDYDLVIQCGGCMFNRRYLLDRVRRAREQGVPMTNYGVALAYMAGILDEIAV